MLTDREKEVLIAYGKSDFDINEAAKLLFLSDLTVKSHLKTLRSKFDSSSSAAAYLKAVKQGFIPL